jgi:hypothetical protein
MVRERFTTLPQALPSRSDLVGRRNDVVRMFTSEEELRWIAKVALEKK